MIIRDLACARLTVLNPNAQHMLGTMTIDSAGFTARITYRAATLVSRWFQTAKEVILYAVI